MVTLTSFREAVVGTGTRYSAARWAPDFARGWPELKALAPFDRNGRVLKLRQFADPLRGYRDAYIEALSFRQAQVARDLSTFRDTDSAFFACCWCPYSEPARRALDEHGSFACHLLLLGGLFARWDIEWQYGAEHAAHGVETWRADRGFEWPCTSGGEREVEQA